MLNLILGRSGTGKTTRVLEELCRAGKERRQLLLVPEQSSHEMERALCRAGGGGVSLYAEVLSFSRLANRIFMAAGGMGEGELDAGGRLLTMYNAVRSVSPALTVYARPSRRPPFLESLLATSDELKSCCVPPERLSQAGELSQGEDGARLRDLGLILGAYDALTERSALDPRDRLTRAAEKLEGCDWGTDCDIWVDGFTDFTPQQQAMLRLLLGRAHRMTVALTCDHLEETDGGAGIFSPARHTAAVLLRMAREGRVEARWEVLEGSCREKAPALVWVERELMEGGTLETGECGDAVELYAALTVRSEVEWVASCIRTLVRREGLRYRDIGVVARSFEGYSHLVESVFRRYEVPVFCSQMTDILEKPVLALVTAALEAVTGGYAYENVFRYLKTGLTDLGEEDRDLLENYVLKWDVRGSRWTQKEPWKRHPRGYGLKLEEFDRALLERVDRARRQVSAPLEALRRSGGRTGREHAMALYRFLEEIGLPQRLDERVEWLHAQGEPALAEEYRQLWDILCAALEQCAALTQDAPMELEEFSGMLRLVLSQYDVGTIPVSLDRVTAGEMTRQTGHRVKVLFVLGADDESIPRVDRETGLLTDDDRQLLAGMGLELGQSAQQRLYREMTTVYEICALPQHRLILSWPGQRGGAECRPCFVVERLRLMFSDLRVVREEELGGVFRLQAPQAALEQAGRSAQVRAALKELPGYAPQVERLERAAGWERGSLSREAVDRLYGSKVAMSASRMDKYKSCHFSYFMRYGLKAELRRGAGFSAPEYGTFLHYVLQHVFEDPAWEQAAGEKNGLRPLVRGAVERYVREELGGLEQYTPRFRYLFGRLLRTVETVVDNVAQELLSSSFRPIAFELGFGGGQELPPVEVEQGGLTVRVSGFVDRVDGWVHDGRLYLRVVDYKTGRKSFDLTEVLHGIGLQMLLYLFTLEHQGEKLYGMPVSPAGVLYLPAREVIVRGGRDATPEELQKQTDKELQRRGLVLQDEAVLSAMEHPGAEGYRFLPLKVSKSTGAITGEALVSAERLGRLERHTRRILEEICTELAAGNIAADPFWRGPEKNACRYCDYAEACHFEEGRGGDCKRWLSAVKPEDFWRQLEEKEETH